MPPRSDPDWEQIMARIDTLTLDISRSMTFDLEEWLEAMVEAMKISPEEFSRLYILDVEPVEIQALDLSDVVSGDKIIYRTTQTYTVRRKTAEEMAADEKTALTQGEN